MKSYGRMYMIVESLLSSEYVFVILRLVNMWVVVRGSMIVKRDW